MVLYDQSFMIINQTKCLSKPLQNNNEEQNEEFISLTPLNKGMKLREWIGLKIELNNNRMKFNNNELNKMVFYIFMMH